MNEDSFKLNYTQQTKPLNVRINKSKYKMISPFSHILFVITAYLIRMNEDSFKLNYTQQTKALNVRINKSKYKKAIETKISLCHTTLKLKF